MAALSLRSRILLLTGISLASLLVAGRMGHEDMQSLHRQTLAAFSQASLAEVTALRTQVAFKTQVQEWKNVLIRGHNADDRAKYWEAFLREETRTRELASKLIDSLPAASPARNFAQQFLKEHRQMGENYRISLTDYDRGGDAAYRISDVLVRGQDRKPTELFDQIVKEIGNARAAEQFRLEREFPAKANRLRWITMGAAGCSFSILFLALSRWVTKPVRAAIQQADMIAEGNLDIQVKPAAITELGVLQRSLNRMASQLYRNQFANNLAVMFLFDPADGKIVDVNSSAQHFYGHSRETLLGMRLSDINISDAAEIERHITSVGTESKQGYYFQHRLADGSVRDVEMFSSPIRSGERTIFHSLVHDITERKRAEADLARISVIRQELVRLATEFVNVPTQLQDDAINRSLATMGQLIGADRSYLFAYDFENGTATNTHEWCAPGIAPEIGDLQQVPLDGYSDWIELHKKGDPVLISSVAALPANDPLRQMLTLSGVRSLVSEPLMQDGKCLGFVGLDAVTEERIWQDDEIALLRVLAELYDNFEARRANERETIALQHRLTAARDEAQAAALAKSLFLANMSHEIRTPLNAILGYAQIMEHDNRDGPPDKRLTAISRSGKHLLTLVADLMELVRSDARSITLTPVDFDFYRALDDVRIMFARQQSGSVLTLEISHALDVPRMIRADQGKIRQILVNLVGNALKFTDKGGVRVSASVQSGTKPDEFVITVDVEDTGHGIGSEELESVFDLFEQAESGRNSGKGVGLGLPLSRRYARALGGDVSVTSRLGEGSCFRFSFLAHLAGGDSAGESLQREIQQLAPGQRECRILVVDDEAANRQMLALMLQDVGFVVEVMENAADALQQLRWDTGIAMVLMDKRMPKMDGYEAVRRLREIPGRSDLPVLMVSASGMANDYELSLAAGANGYVSKPVNRRELLRKIGELAGVTYEYEEAKPQPPAASMDFPILKPAALGNLSAEHYQLLDQALHRGDIIQLRGLIDELSRDHSELAAAMNSLVEAYDYARLRTLLDSLKTTTP